MNKTISKNHKFNSSRLQKIDQESELIFKENLQSIKNVSGDIVALESRLKQARRNSFRTNIFPVE